MAKNIAFIDSEIGIESKSILDLGAVRQDRTVYHGSTLRDFCAFIANCDYLCGHNIVHHDMKYLRPEMDRCNFPQKAQAIDTLYLSPLLFPNRPYHALLKDDKLQSDELNNPLNDALKAEKLFYDEVNAFRMLTSAKKQIYCCLLYQFPEFQGFFNYVGFIPYRSDLPKLIISEYKGKICENVNIAVLIKHYPKELAYALALIGSKDYHSITPPWLLKNCPKIENVIKFLCNTPCSQGCDYCKSVLDIHAGLKRFFGYDSFRTYNGEPLQEQAAQAAMDGKSLLAVFPTGGGKSITFQLPALMAGQTVHGLTVVISPLQSLMKDQVDHLDELGMTDAVTVNGLLSPVERADALRRVSDGSATILYISPEQLRSRTIEKLLLSRNVVRFVIDEAHCFSAWGQDFRVDYLYIGDFIRQLQKQKQDRRPIPVSCFTATAKQKVISDICDYFKRKLDLDLELFTSSATRENLHYVVLFRETEEEKYSTLRSLIEQKNCPTIVYVSRTRRTREISEKLTKDGFPARPFNGKMDSQDKILNQEAFISNEVKVIVATSAFGMGVDKKDVGLVIHYDISDSLENYVQEAGRAGRDPMLQAECYVLFNNNDLNKHFILLNQTKLSIGEIQQVWKAIKDLTKQRQSICCSALEIARQAGWDDSNQEVETRVKTAIAALENAGYIKRGRNVPHVYASSILAKNMQEASTLIDRSNVFTEAQRQDAKRVIKSLISSRSIAEAGNNDAESRVDYLADILGMEKGNVITVINLMRQEKLLADAQDMTAYILSSDSENKSMLILNKFVRLEQFLLDKLPDEGCTVNYKEWNEEATEAGIPGASVKSIRTLLFFLAIKNAIKKQENAQLRYADVIPLMPVSVLKDKLSKRISLCRFIVSELYRSADTGVGTNKSDEKKPVLFSLVGLLESYKSSVELGVDRSTATLSDMSDALLYLSKIGAMKLEGGFLVLYNGMEIKRLVTDNRIRYKTDDYRLLDEFYKQRIRQIHIVGEYANMMVRDYEAALQFVQDYFHLDFKRFLSKYFKGDRSKEIDRNITPEKYNQLFGELSDVQSTIINDDESKYIVVAAGPGSGKTRVLVHKLAALLLLEDVKHEQLLMLTFSRAAATEFKRRLIGLIGNAAHFVEIKTFHSYCFDLLGKIGKLENLQNVVKDAADMIQSGDVEQSKIMKRVLVIDEAQDMDEHEFNLVQALMKINEDMRVIAVGDDDQNIYSFRGSDSKYLKTLIDYYGAVKYEMEENYRSKKEIVLLSNAFVAMLKVRMKSKAIVSMQEESGIVEIIRHKGNGMEAGVAEHVAAMSQKGKIAVLTCTNYEALQITGLLNHRGIRAKLIQSNDGFQLYNLAEVRFFLDFIDARRGDEAVIGKPLWEAAKKALYDAYEDSSCINNCKNMIQTYESTYRTIYRTDLEEFVRESSYDDFYEDSDEYVYVSTIHKTKGREFDSVLLMLKNVTPRNDDERRNIYVALTRAKGALYIHCNTSLFDHYDLPGIVYSVDSKDYDDPTEILIQLSYRDIYLDYYKNRQDAISKLRSGNTLSVTGDYLTAEIEERTVRIGRFSKAFYEKLCALKEKGFEPSKATVGFIVLWKGETDKDESFIVLPTLYLKKKEM